MIVLIRAAGSCVNFAAPPSTLAFSAMLNLKLKQRYNWSAEIYSNNLKYFICGTSVVPYIVPRI